MVVFIGLSLQVYPSSPYPLGNYKFIFSICDFTKFIFSICDFTSGL